ncbi:MAG: undecaprenyl-diphosphate phosphatase [Candidatus Bathyarchaeota archaeon]|nr:MAG: undecaprenyl-diphosphate phosphatase [Candidatus Bathyarchaeota archaeon]
MASLIDAIALGIIQGITEWLPVSSSGHLAIAKEFLDWQPPVLFHIFLHISTLLVVLYFFREDIVQISKAVAKRDFRSEGGRLALFIIIGSLPTAVIGYVFQDVFKSFFDNLLVVGVALLATGCLLYFSKQREGKRSLNHMDSFLIGIAQGIAIVPGISRSGVTISTGLLRKVDHGAAFRFSFLLSIPATLGAAIAESSDLTLLADFETSIAVIVGMISGIIVGYLSLQILRKIILNKKLHWFAIYCWAMGSLVIIFQIL